MAFSITREDLYRRAMVVRAKKRLSQNFLVEPSILSMIADSINAGPGDTVVEIGPGLGFLTEFLVRTGARVFAVELDEDMAFRLKDLAAEFPNLTIIRQDFLHFDPESLKAKNIKVVGNVPYQITSPIVVRVLGELDEPGIWLPYVESLTMTVQLELARRLVSPPGSKEYGQITILADYYATAKMIGKVGSEHFIPRPDVESAVVQLVKRERPKVTVKDASLLRRLVKAGFKERRKMIKNNLGFTHLNQEELTSLLMAHGISPAARAEGLSLDKFAQLADALKAYALDEND
ncbi:MAG TPA: 16S rRNA (adenine(1518)-N(6)/adenine(1519)-N(6))-dimethyltransferase RsmA [Candidatus Obscuribacter sp.]|nr:16S rRNA (adenine(1518)-N(6)/adenine(1519)-N(6))-dimethyltransferase RsmA [Candidatus Obscuribacter sp.]HMY51551.1 16S rRNA (adenine(1518)-N(6)/adenine(1519)-N(6))-dimethyltransferase RsmA [Candidatus Obscuribacter sp.]HNA71752.1 16S rRNA (adenine(1518)-N(6)/adenine(1519)-N(6))-dimethyltransferase RsmA [Candidatus Obscuribacter sp.]HNB17515.1 16S rRNA (adenine(1518)-N(6)/adenine(1519)-N(6))-dimethyltransferase RsmA [Candidatus Obscuribacter sp.]HND66145.1 16S rRNA (adenine(1518)-N(6)/adenine